MTTDLTKQSWFHINCQRYHTYSTVGKSFDMAGPQERPVKNSSNYLQFVFWTPDQPAVAREKKASSRKQYRWQ